jgi:hypothetical protein
MAIQTNPTTRGCALLLFAAACGTDSSSQIASEELCGRKEQKLAAAHGSTIDDEFEVLARLLPGGFGGLTIDSMYLKDVAEADAARGTAAALASCSGTLQPYLDLAQSASVRRGNYDWIELRAWYLDIQMLDGWISADMNENTNRLEFEFVASAELERFRTGALSRGVPAAALALSIGTQ